ncbi:MAG: hypothetical protein HYT69_01305 [Candidatus Zambryskibacteria bacterium]|nr:hypothetical protein [Candidatus Zambryskibacteria bacterium]
MHARINLALFVSIFLIGSALWIRLSDGATVNYELTLVEPSAKEDGLLDYFLKPESNAVATAVKSLPKTDLLGQQLILEYVDLATSGQSSEETIATLAEKYIDGIPGLTTAQIINSTDLNIVSDSKESFQKYADEIIKIHQKYSESIQKKYSGIEIGVLDSTLYSLTSDTSTIYSDTASKLKNMVVPSALATLHVELINTYLLNTESMKAIANTETDSAKAFAGLISLSNSTNREVAILSEISRKLTEAGI